MRYDAAIIGGGAAGLFCAITAGLRGRRVVLIEHNSEVGRKILISGGGRCNFTNLSVAAENFVSSNPHFARSALAGFTPNDFIRLVSTYGIIYYEKKLGQLFCRGSSRQIVDMLLDQCRQARVEVRTGCRVAAVEADAEGYTVRTSQGPLRSTKLVIAAGGLSFPKIGATGLGYDIARQFGLDVEPVRPSLVALTMADRPMPELAGVSTEVVASTGKASFRENILFTHRGLSGPAILQISNYWAPEKAVEIDLAPDLDIRSMLSATGAQAKTTRTVLSHALPGKLIERLLPGGLLDKKVAALGRTDIEQIVEAVRSWAVRFRDTEGWDRAEVTIGGVSTKGLSSKTMEARNVPGLYFIGEVVDVTGWLGGYNFQWAWSSGHAAGKDI